MQEPKSANPLIESFSKLFPDLTGEELDEAHRRFRQYVELAWEICEETFDRSAENLYSEGTKVDFLPTINQKQ